MSYSMTCQSTCLHKKYVDQSEVVLSKNYLRKVRITEKK